MFRAYIILPAVLHALTTDDVSRYVHSVEKFNETEFNRLLDTLVAEEIANEAPIPAGDTDHHHVKSSLEVQLEGLYDGLFNGHGLPQAEADAVNSVGGDAVYGEIKVDATEVMFGEGGLNLREGDAFADLGSGTGKVVLQAALHVPGLHAYGYELAASRLATAKQALGRLNTTLAVDFISADIAKVNLGATKVNKAYTCSTMFTDKLMSDLARVFLTMDVGGRGASLRAFDPDTMRYYSFF